MNIKSIILAAGLGTRMKSKLPKVLHSVCGKPMVSHVMKAAQEAGCMDQILVLGHKAEEVSKILGQDIKTVIQAEQLGTGHAVKMAKDHISDEDLILILCGDTPLIKGETLKAMVSYHEDKGLSGCVMTAMVESPKGYGRIVKDSLGNFQAIVEEKDATEEEREIKEINGGMYTFKGNLLREALDKLNNNNAQGEYYLTDVIAILREKGERMGTYTVSLEEIMGVNSRVELSKAEALMRNRINQKHMVEGVTIINSDNTYIEDTVTIGRDTIIYPGVVLRGNTSIGEDCIIGENTKIEDSKIGNNVEIQSSTILQSSVDDKTKVGPYAYLRPKSIIGKNVKIGDFVEVKNSTIGDNSKASHLAYIGDAEVGSNVNIGCGVVFVNYDGKNKFKSIVKDNAFVGSNVNLVAPVVVEEGGYLATGSTITQDVPSRALAVARQRQVVKEGWVDKKGILDKK